MSDISISNGQWSVTGSTPSSSASASANASLDQDAFLKILVAELKNQSPDSPADTGQMMAQEAQFSQLNATKAMQAATEKTLAAIQSSMGLGMVGQKITATSSTGGSDITGVVTSVKLGTDGPVLKIGDMEVALSSVKEVKPNS